MNDPEINGVAYDHSSCRIRLGGVIEKRIDKIDWGHGMEGMKKQHGTSVQPISRTRGKYKVDEVKFTMQLAAWHEFRGRLGDGFLEKVFDITVEKSEDGIGFSKDTIKGCKIQHVPKASSEGGDHDVVEVTCDAMYVLEAGIAPIKNFRR
jgi:hypothetical protein